MHALRPLLLTLTLSLAVSACSQGDGGTDDGGEDLTPVAESGEPAELKPIDPATTGTVRGVVRFEGEPPPRKEIGTGGIPACEQHDEPLRTEAVLVRDGKLENAFVHVKKGLAGWEIPPAEEEQHVIDQVGCRYTPHVSVMRAGQTLSVRNSDPETHNVHITARRNSNSVNLTQGPGTDPLRLDFERREHLVHLQCDLHPWMHAWLHVSDHPFYDLTGVDGAFEIAGLPPGTYTLEAVHESYKARRATVTVEPGGTAEVDFAFSE